MTIRFVSVRTWAMFTTLGALLALLVACGAAVTPVPSPTATSEPARGTQLPTPTLAPPGGTVELPPGRELPTPGGPEVPAPVLDAVRDAAAAAADVSSDKVTIVQTTQTEFPSTALGCPEPGRAYAQVIVPGYVVIVEAGGDRSEFHTDADASQVIRCVGPSPATSEVEKPTMPAGESLTEAATNLVSRETGLRASDLTLLSVDSVEWPDASLGCPQPGMMYAQVITPGFRLVFQGPTGEQFEVHTDARGSKMVLCSGSREGSREMTPVPSASGQQGPSPATRDAALEAVVRASGRAVDQLEVVSWDPVQWRDSSLGCPQPGVNYLMVITPGYRFKVRAGTTVYEVHTDQRNHAVICENAPNSL
ncbi:MAG: hypothetical protein M5U01_05955 [Ardenticatenaceae bacterium]|nr:hypothetical protein [Ardenticatenaceae bacterium]